jgi:hypothetical protein
MKTAIEWFVEQYEQKIGKSISSVMADEIKQAKEMEKKQKGYTKTDVEYMLYKCCDDLGNNKRVFWDIDGLVNEIISTFKRE